MAVTPDSVAFDRPDLATVTDAETARRDRPAAVVDVVLCRERDDHAIYRGKEAVAKVTVQVHLTDYGPGLGPLNPAVQALNGTNFANDPAPGITPLLYPYDKTVWPLGSDVAPPHVERARGRRLLPPQLRREKLLVRRLLPRCRRSPAQMRLDQTVWDRLTASNDAANGADPLTFTLSRKDNTAGPAYLTATQTWTIAPESLAGAIYYWTASETAGVAVGHITRFSPGRGRRPFSVNNGTCMGCHAVNAKGTMLVGRRRRPVNDGTRRERCTPYPSVAPYGNWSGTRPWASSTSASRRRRLSISPPSSAPTSPSRPMARTSSGAGPRPSRGSSASLWAIR